MEFRHESWFTDEIYQVEEAKVALCVAETESITTPEERTAKYIYFRFRRPSYKPRELKKLADRVERCVADGLETYAFFKHEEDPRSPLNAVELLKSAEEAGGLNLGCIPARTRRAILNSCRVPIPICGC